MGGLSKLKAYQSNDVKYLEALKNILGELNPYLLALWCHAKEAADERGVPDVIEGAFPDAYRDAFASLRELRYNLRRYVSSTHLDAVRRDIEHMGVETAYCKYVSQLERRAQGQFFTPYSLAKRMLSFSDARGSVYDIGIGTGVFLKVASELGFTRLMGIEISPILCDISRFNLADTDARVEIVWGDFLLDGNTPYADLWVSNPPYTRHHQIPLELKRLYLSIVKQWVPKMSSFSSLYMYFFVKVVGERSKWQCASFICPRSLYDSVYSRELKRWLIREKVLVTLEVFHNQRVFEDAETGPVVTYLTSRTCETVAFRNCQLTTESIEVLNEVSKRVTELDPKLPWTNIAIGEVLEGGGVRLGAVFSVVRGVATGANDYFVVNEDTVRRYGLPPTVLVPVIAKTRYCLKDVFTREDWEKLRLEGREVYLLDLSRDENHPSVRRYLELGEKLGIPKRSLVRTRRKWYAMEKRKPPPIFVTYLSRRCPRFILNEAGVVPLNVFLCLYPKVPLTRSALIAIWRYLNSEESLKRFEYLARNYGEDTLKVEPRILDLLEIPEQLIEKERVGLLYYIFSDKTHM